MADLPIIELLGKQQSAIMGVVNVTPDSFSDGGRFSESQSAIEHGLSLLEQGADLVDVGGESTRPGAAEVSLEVELARVIPVIEGLVKQTNAPISVDTKKPQVMQAAIDAGAQMVNDVNALQADGALSVLGNSSAMVCLMHMLGQPSTMQNKPVYDNVVDEVGEFLLQRIEACQQGGIDTKRIVVDPGIGFGKTLAHNLELLASLPKLGNQLACPLLIGVSRKSLINDLLQRELEQRLPASLGLAVQAVLNGAKIIRVHDVQASHDAIRSVEAVLAARQ